MVIITELSLSKSDVKEFIVTDLVGEDIFDFNKIIPLSHDFDIIHSQLTEEDCKWIRKNWGCEYKPYDLQFTDSSMSFKTIDSSPIPVIKCLSKILKRRISVKYASESFEKIGLMVIDRGKVISDFRPVYKSNEAIDIYMSLFNAYDYFYQNEDGDWIEKTDEEWGDYEDLDDLDETFNNFDDDFEELDDLDELGFTEFDDIYT